MGAKRYGGGRGKTVRGRYVLVKGSSYLVS